MDIIPDFTYGKKKKKFNWRAESGVKGVKGERRVESDGFFIEVTFITDNERRDYKTEVPLLRILHFPLKCLQNHIGLWNTMGV